MGNWIIGFLNYLIAGLGSILSVITSILPPSPFKLLDSSGVASWLGYANYFLPVDYVISSGEAWIAAIATYYLLQPILRWIKAED